MNTTRVVIDSDAHVIETDATWDYLQPDEQKFRPRLVSSPADPAKQYWIVDDHVAGPPLLTATDEQVAEQSARSRRNITTEPAARKMADIELRLNHMSELGIDVQVLHNSLWVGPVTDRPDTEIALCRSWNRWLADIWREGKGRLRWTCVVPTLTLDVAIEELRFAKANGCVGLCVEPFHLDLMMLDPYYYPLYKVAEELDVPVIVHIANGDPALARSLHTRLGLLDGFASFRIPTVTACYGVLSSELNKTFPNLRWGFIEASAQWMPWVANELSRRSGDLYGPLDNPFINKKAWVTTQIGDDYHYLANTVGIAPLLIGTDYGHTDPSSEVDAIAQFKALDIPDDLKYGVLCENPAALYGITNASL